jgi:hypothetical protein
MATQSSDQKLDLIVAEMATIRVAVEEFTKLSGKVTVLESKASAQDTIIVSLVAEVKHLKEQVNGHDQFGKLNALRILNVPGSDSETGLAACVYDTVLKPILAAAKLKGDLTTLPQVGTTITEVFRAGRFSQGANKPPPPIIVKFTTPSIRLAVLKNKRINMPPPLVAGAKRYIIVEDLTPSTHRKLKELAEDDRVEKAWTMGGLIWATTKKNKVPFKVRSIFDSNDFILG